MKNKKIFILTAVNFVIILIITAGFTASCDRENTDPPVITNIRLIDPEMADLALEGAGLESWVVIQGKGFGTTQEIYFNEFPAVFNPAYVTETNIVVQIPAGTPNIGTDSLAPNTVRVVTQYGENTYSDFIVFAPPAEIRAMSNEFALPGDTLHLFGVYFYFVDSIIFPGNFYASNFWYSEDGKYCGVVVPDEALNPGAIRVITSGGIGGSMRWTQFRDTISIIKCNFDDINIFIWGCNIINDNGSFPGASGNFAHISASNIPEDNVAWWEGSRSCNLDSIQWFSTNELGNLTSDYILKFEIFVDEPWETGSILFDFTYNFNYMYLFQPWVIDGERVSIKSYHWSTVYVPLSEFRSGQGIGEPAASVGDLVWNNGYGRLALLHFNNGNTEAELPALFLENFSIGIDNIRIVGLDPGQ